MRCRFLRAEISVPRPTSRGLALLGLAVGTYLAGRLVGTWELYLFAFAFAAAVLVSWLTMIGTGRRIRLKRDLTPDRPVAGDEPELRTLIRNSSWLPGPDLTLRSPLGGLGSEEPEAQIDSLAPREQKMLKLPVGRVVRGVHNVPPARLMAEDPLGLATVVRRASDPLRVTVYPRLVHLDSCALFPQIGLRHDWGGYQSSPSQGAFEFRGVRPHQPGEPLNHVHWKSTAKTGILMLRETEEPAGAEVTVLLDGTAAHLVGRAPASNYEMAVRVAGSVADFALRGGRSVAFLSHERELRRVRLAAESGGRGTLLELLAEAQPNSPAPLLNTVRRLRAERAHLLQAENVTVVSLSLERQLVHTLIALREEGVRLSLVYVLGSSFSEPATPADAPLLPFLPPRQPGSTDEPAASDTEEESEPQRGPARLSSILGQGRRTGQTSLLPAETRASLLALASLGIPCLTVSRGDNLDSSLSLSRPSRGSRQDISSA